MARNYSRPTKSFGGFVALLTPRIY